MKIEAHFLYVSTSIKIPTSDLGVIMCIWYACSVSLDVNLSQLSLLNLTDNLTYKRPPNSFELSSIRLLLGALVMDAAGDLYPPVAITPCLYPLCNYAKKSLRASTRANITNTYGQQR